MFLNLRGRRCLVVGGGPVGIRRARALAAAGATVRLVCLEPPAPVLGGVEWQTETYRADHLHGAFLVFAAATPEVNDRVVTDARARGLLVNSASDPLNSDFVVPAIGTVGGIQLAVGTGASAPGLAARIRDHLAAHIDEPLTIWVELVAGLRDEIRTNLSPDRGANLLRRLAEPEWLERIRTAGPEEARRAMRAVVDRELGR